MARLLGNFEVVAVAKIPTEIALREVTPGLVVPQNVDLTLRFQLLDSTTYTGLWNKWLDLYITCPDGSSAVFHAITDPDGLGIITLVAETLFAIKGIGVYDFTIEFAGDETYEGCEEKTHLEGITGVFQW